MSEEIKALVTKKLVGIFNESVAEADARLEAIRALGRVGGVDAAKKLVSIYNTAAAGSDIRLEAIKALGEVGRG